jgi:hypothetical protein
VKLSLKRILWRHAQEDAFFRFVPREEIPPARPQAVKLTSAHRLPVPVLEVRVLTWDEVRERHATKQRAEIVKATVRRW